MAMTVPHSVSTPIRLGMAIRPLKVSDRSMARLASIRQLIRIAETNMTL